MYFSFSLTYSKGKVFWIVLVANRIKQHDENKIDLQQLAAEFAVKFGAPPMNSRWDSSRLKFFNVVRHEEEIKSYSRGMSPEEVLAYYGCVLSNLDEYEQWFFVTTFNRGRIEAKNKAVSKLFIAMSGKNAESAALEYLTRFGTNWQNENGQTSLPRTVTLEFTD